MNLLNKDEIFQEMKELLAKSDLNSRQRKELINYYKQIKHDASFIKELKDHDPHRWLMALEEAYSTCDIPYFEGRNLDWETERLMIALKEKWIEEGYELIQPFKTKEDAKFFEELASKASSSSHLFNANTLKGIYKFKHWVIFIIIPTTFAIICGFIFFGFKPLARYFDPEVTHSMMPLAIPYAIICAFSLWIYSRKDRFINKAIFKSERAYHQQIDNFVSLYCQLTEEKHLTVNRHHLHRVSPFDKFLKELTPE